MYSKNDNRPEPKIQHDKIIKVERLTPDIFRFRLKSSYISTFALPGQFVNIKCSEGIEAILRRPVSICAVDENRKTYDIVIQTRGQGTAYLAKKSAGERLDIIGPLGHPFFIEPDLASGEKIVLIGGGIGIFPLLFLSQKLSNINDHIFTCLGFRSVAGKVLYDEFKSNCGYLEISTEDGSYGTKGYVTSILERIVAEKRIVMIYACGPTPMLSKIAGIAAENKIKCQVSLEQRMACGVGACLVCACRTYKKDGSGGKGYSHVCKDGPIFWSDEVVFNENENEIGNENKNE